MKIVTCLIISILFVASFTALCRAESDEHKFAEFASGSGNIIYLSLGVGLPALTDGDKGKSNAFRVADATGTAVALTEGLKALIKEKRPDSNQHDSFPSGHAAAAFAVATVESELHPKQAAFWYLGATIIGWSRIRLNRHHPFDVVAGAALGYATARYEMGRAHGILLTPWIGDDKSSVGFAVNKFW